MTFIRDLLDLPKTVRKGDFVLSLNKGIAQPEETVESYAITPNLQQSFERVFSIIDSALSSGRSQAVYLHGSFGSGKSHFMAMLDLMLAGHPSPWGRAELHPLRKRYDWVAKAKLLRLPLHMVGATSMEEKIFGAYVRIISEHHPDAEIPALYADQELFDNARTQRENMGDETFFEVLNRAAPQKTAGWGKLAKEAVWDADRLDQAVQSVDPEVRGQIFSALVKTHFPAFASQTHSFVDLDRGLGVMSRHAAQLGYHAVVLYLDELILWLAGHFADLSWVQNEAQKIAKLKEAQDERRDVPIISFIARQRDLSEMVGDDAAGAERLTLRDSIEFHSGRLEEVKLEDHNLPWIVERRVLRPKNERAKETLEDGFVKMQRSASTAWGTLLGAHADEKDFRKVYPFSPALVEVLVALSDCLQRERTAIRILMELLVDHLTDLKLGQVVPVGEIYDVIAGGEDAFDNIIKDRFERAKNLYNHHFLPLIHAANDCGTREKCQRLRDAHPVSLGCSGCTETACRNDNRLAKTLLLAALVP
ncbi:MAG: phage resistance protein, partial [Deltaproteobacteria bacterium]|nr:phage resistance protein [Deltaproteobacteria bacterium]